MTTLDGLREAAEQQRVRDAAGPRREERGADPRGAREGLRARAGAARPARRRACRSSASVVEALRAHPAAVEVSAGGQRAARPRDVPRPRRDRDRDRPGRAARRTSSSCRGCSRSPRRATRRRPSSTKQGLRVDLRVVPPEDFGSLLQHFTGSKDHNVALREDAQRRGLSVSEYGVTVVETGEVHRFARRGRAVPLPRLRLDPARAARERRRARGRARRRPAGARRARRPRRRAPLPLDVVVGREGRRSRRWRARRAALGYRYLALTDHSHYLREGRMEAQWRGDRRRSTSASSRSGCCAGRGEHPRRRLGRRRRRACSRELDWVVASLHAAFDRSPTERDPRRDRPSARRLHRPPDGPASSTGGRAPTIDVERVDRPRGRDRHRARDQQPARPPRPARRPRAARRRGGRARPDHHRRALDGALSATPSSASPRRAGRG